MAADPELTAETRAWLTKSARDCQQAAEKALKGFLTWHGRPFRKTHNLEEIGEQCLVLDLTLLEIVDQAASMHGNFPIPALRKELMPRKPGKP
jgi:HEPN domain-containing protein